MRCAATLALVVLVAAIGCRRTPAPAAALDPLPGAPPSEPRALSLDGGFIPIRIDIPREPPGPKPAVIALLGQQPRMLSAGLVTIHYRVHWEMLAPLRTAQPKPPPGERTWGKWLLASPSPGTVGKGYF